MNKEIKTPEELLNQLGEVMKGFNMLKLTTSLGLDPSIYHVWKRRKSLPYKNAKKIFEFLDMHCADCVSLCCNLMDYYKEESRKHDQKIAERVERNRERTRLRNRGL